MCSKSNAPSISNKLTNVTKLVIALSAMAILIGLAAIGMSIYTLVTNSLTTTTTTTMSESDRRL